MTRVAVIGSTGQFGSDLVKVLQHGTYDVFSLSHTDVECTDPASVQTALAAIRPDIVVNCAAYVRVDDCQDQPEETFRVNAVGALHVARSCATLDALCVYISTDYVFDGEKGTPYTEADPPCPINVYGATKLAGEHLVRQACPRWLIVRTASLFGKAGSRGKGGNFVETILARARGGESLRVVHDTRMSPTSTYDAAGALEQLLRSGASGLVHLTNAGACSWYEFTCKAIQLVGLHTDVTPITADAYPSKARRPRDSSMQSVRLEAMLEHPIRSWQEALHAYLVEQGHVEDGGRA